nr:dnaJ homolog subfamily C member 10-like [Nerophis lumbriciformis]XP_061826960.1 dnaJ homolog subfamily C member 10-like [Nerophis lumbriciformis]XP_061826961.1 dnaJ homolog subfamily C member 10-like [Nerophis lumbriciformis]XP_061826962.1 dnaJ homolog subfamily C member 10-like [Nerophis lumbriciformis]XP_061826963.1 dnaJ homolog subfamily C member 10-like [Nerophis lumbriciformis]
MAAMGGQVMCSRCVHHPIWMFLSWLLLVTMLGAVCAAGSDYYNLLGVNREATTREIRQAFKKLALTMHPDKNPGDSSAHEKFLQVNRAYEVLKDEDLRKKYDKYGEKGLDEQQGGRYESWNYYRYDFGIYDDDLEIITLDSGDFEAAVNSGEIWFINFYFPRCSHCHELAPTWREFAKEMDGVVRIGAVNCGDNNHLCRRKGISSYPSLYIFTAGQKPVKFSGERVKDKLVTFCMQFIQTSVTELRQGNVFSEIDSAFASGLGWLITFCSDTGDCLESRTRQKLASMLDGLVKVGWMDCSIQQELCQSFQVTSGATALFPPGSALNQQGSVLWLRTLDSREIYTQVIDRLPDLQLLTADTFHSKLARHRWLVSFTFGHRNPSEYKKLQAFFRNDHIQVGRVDCSADAQLCQSLYIHKACVAVFKGLGVHDFEIHHGKDVLYNIVAFARDSVRAHVTTLRPDNFPSDRKEAWLVDFFAPWCPPCRALLPELRKASIQLAGQMKFGTLDCTIHQDLCSTYNIHAYPTTVLFNGSSVHEYEGQHSADGILEFIQDLIHPSVVVLDPPTFSDKVQGREEGKIWAVDFYAPWCGPCQALLPEWRRMARMLAGQILVGSVDCQRFQSFCQSQHVRAYPEIRLYSGSTRKPGLYTSYNGWHRDAHSLKSWALSALPKASVDLTPDSFRSLVVAGHDHWVLDFYAPWCGPCQHFAPEFEVLARVLKGEVRAGKIDCQAHYQTCQSAGITAYPTVRFYPYQHAKRHAQSGEHINSREANVIADIIRQRLQQLSSRSHNKKKDEL